MDDTVRIEPGYHIIDTQAWVNQRTSAPVTELTRALNEFCDHEVFDDLHIHLDTSARMQLWAAARGWRTSPETTYHHTHDELSDHVSIVLATDPDRCAYALVQVDHDTPDVYLDLTTDDDYWAQVEPVDIVCTTGNHRWTWPNQYEMLDDTGTYLTFREVFGSTPGAPYAQCRDCLAYDDGERDEPCDCDGRHTIYCPTCDQRCRLELTAVPIMDALVAAAAQP